MAGETARSQLWTLMVSASFYRPVPVSCWFAEVLLHHSLRLTSAVLSCWCFSAILFHLWEIEFIHLEGVVFKDASYFSNCTFIVPGSITFLGVEMALLCAWNTKGEQIPAGRAQSVSIQWINKVIFQAICHHNPEDFLPFKTLLWDQKQHHLCS